MTQAQVDLWNKLESIFMPYSSRERERALKAPLRCAHYTTAEAALKIISSKQIWMRNTNCMADYREVQHGYDILFKFFAQEARKTAFIEALEKCIPGVSTSATKLFDEKWYNIRTNTFVTSLSEHANEEDMLGRLSMWRAFGDNPTRVALVFKIPAFSPGTKALHIFFSPVAYFTESEAHRELEKVTENIQTHRDFLQSVGKDMVNASVFNMFLITVTCLKHEAFREEREWRAVYSPKMDPSPLMQHAPEAVRGIPQLIYKVPMDVAVSKELADIDLSQILDRVIIGPTQYSLSMAEAFVEALTKAGVSEADKRVCISNIPIRT